MKESKALQDRWVKASFFTKYENDKILQALKLHQLGEMHLLDVVSIFDFIKNKSIQRTRDEQTQKQIDQILRK